MSLVEPCEAEENWETWEKAGGVVLLMGYDYFDRIFRSICQVVGVVGGVVLYLWSPLAWPLWRVLWSVSPN